MSVKKYRLSIYLAGGAVIDNLWFTEFEITPPLSYSTTPKKIKWKEATDIQRLLTIDVGSILAVVQEEERDL